MLKIATEAQFRAALEEQQELADSGQSMRSLDEAIEDYRARQIKKDRSGVLWLVAIAIGVGLSAALFGCASYQIPAAPARQFVFHPLKPKPALPHPVVIGPKDRGAAVCMDAANVHKMAEMIRVLEADDNYVRGSFDDQIDAYRKCVQTGKGCE